MKLRDIKELTNEEMQLKLEESKKELFNLRFKQATNQLDNPMKIVEVRKTIAKIKTLLREEELKATV